MSKIMSNDRYFDMLLDMPKYMSTVMTLDMYNDMSDDVSKIFDCDMSFDMPLGTVRFTGKRTNAKHSSTINRSGFLLLSNI
jgi:hypothetical protein